MTDLEQRALELTVDLFTNEGGHVAERLVLSAQQGRRYLGGWSPDAITARIVRALTAVRDEATEAERERCARVCERVSDDLNRESRESALMRAAAGAAMCASAIWKGDPNGE